jgi:two-component system nitrogen regulation sensor histidine kinase NtrY
MTRREGPLRHRRDNRLIAAVLLAVFFIWGAIALSQEGGRPIAPEAITNRVSLFILWYLDVTLIAATLFVIFRALVKLMLDRRRGVLGAKFKTKLLVTHLGLTLIPIALLFLAATNLLQRAIDRWFAAPVETIVRGAESLHDLADRRAWDATGREARAIARLLPPGADASSIQETFRRDLDLHGYASAELYPPSGSPVRVGNPDGVLPPPFAADQIAEATSRGSSHSLDVLPDGGHWFRSAVASRRGVIVVGIRVGPSEAAPADLVARAASDYRKMEVQKSAIKATNILVFTLLTLALLFAAIWTGLTLARRITTPIEALAESTRRIAGGDLDARVDVNAGDELGILVDSFNTMTSELRDNRARLERTNIELLASNERNDRERVLLSAILDAARTGILAVDADGRVHVANPAALEILGLDAAPLSIADLRNRADLAPVFESLDLARQGIKPAPREFSPEAPGQRRRAEISVSAMPGGEERPRGFVIALEDTTEVTRAQKLAAWTEAARRVAHEIKNPLTPIKLSAERMIRKLDAKDSDSLEAARQGAGLIIEEVDLLKTLVDQFSRFARMPESRPAPTDLSALAERTVALYRNAKEGVKIALQDRLPRPTYTLDGEQVQRALVNLLDNALEACSKGGGVTLSLSESAGTLTIQVSDTGTGIAPADRDRIFLPDFSTKHGSAGLGLAIVSRIVADHRGSIRWEANRPKGSSFVIEIPAA